MKHILITTIAALVLVGCASVATPLLHKHAYEGKVAEVKKHLAAGTDVNTKIKDFTPLHRAVVGGHKPIVEMLISKGAALNAKDDKNGRTALHWAAYQGNTDMVELLIENGAQVFIRSKLGLTPFAPCG